MIVLSAVLLVLLENMLWHESVQKITERIWYIFSITDRKTSPNMSSCITVFL